MGTKERLVVAKRIIDIASNIDVGRFSSDHWIFFNRGKTVTPSGLVNFRSSGLSWGLDDVHTLEKLPGLIIDVLDRVPVSELISSLPRQNIGNCAESVLTSHGYCNGNDLFFCVWLNQLSGLTRGTEKILEIGGGYGGFARVIIGALPKLVSYTMVELPLSAMLAAYYLHESTACGIFLNDQEIRAGMGQPIVKIYTPNHNIDRSSGQFDLIINTRSMMEMNLETIAFYFDYINRTLKVGGVFFNINRYVKATSGDVVRICDFPYDDHWDLLHSSRAFRQRKLHCIISKRLDGSSAGDLKSSLEELAQLPQSSVSSDTTSVGSELIRIVVRLKGFFLKFVMTVIRIIPSGIRQKLGRLFLAME
ncbi:putative sugar O-methyltransferase [Litoricolaceae bacterium]|nr:putative sugar O-methyltransferase [Litorivicinaceae bacterium]